MLPHNGAIVNKRSIPVPKVSTWQGAESYRVHMHARPRRPGPRRLPFKFPSDGESRLDVISRSTFKSNLRTQVTQVIHAMLKVELA